MIPVLILILVLYSVFIEMQIFQLHAVWVLCADHQFTQTLGELGNIQAILQAIFSSGHTKEKGAAAFAGSAMRLNQ